MPLRYMRRRPLLHYGYRSSRPTRQVGLPSRADERSALLPIHSLSHPSAPSRPPPLCLLLSSSSRRPRVQSDVQRRAFKVQYVVKPQAFHPERVVHVTYCGKIKGDSRLNCITIGNN
ncbi:hypothetical protein L210DRAFT_984203 [Boletus edulis BED1]|uniref:Uncharacterized protein n=1 Tax=Boletus edulis BED1 TaxID=1328754 RepID=A0AAD4BEC2_BOLED|nr:hypothetical protein L210DRAFT_984203 [Boletus edulis BED1]